MASSAKQKGNSWEREICKFLGETLGGNFQRVPNSGAYIGGKNVHRKASLEVGQARAAKGDIIPPDALPKLNLEAKNYKVQDYCSGWISVLLPVPCLSSRKISMSPLISRSGLSAP